MDSFDIPSKRAERLSIEVFDELTEVRDFDISKLIDSMQKRLLEKTAIPELFLGTCGSTRTADTVLTLDTILACQRQLSAHMPMPIMFTEVSRMFGEPFLFKVLPEISIVQSANDMQGRLGSLFGMPIFQSPLIPKLKRVQFRFPRSKKKRIQKKWKKNDKNFKQVPNDTAYLLQDAGIAMAKSLLADMKDMPYIKAIHHG